MTALLFGILIGLFAVLLEAWFGAYGFLLPFGAITVFYLSVVYDWRGGLIAAFAIAPAIDLVFMRHSLPSLPSCLAAVIIGTFWLWRADSRQALMRMVPGAIIGLIATTPPIIRSYFLTSPTPDMLLQGSLTWLFSLLAAAVLALLCTMGYDWLAENLGLESFEKARERYIHSR